MQLNKILKKLFTPKKRKYEVYHHDIFPKRRKIVLYPGVLSNAITMKASSINGRVKYS